MADNKTDKQPGNLSAQSPGGTEPVTSLNLDELDVESLERRVKLITTLREAQRSVAPRDAPMKCEDFSCDWFD